MLSPTTFERWHIPHRQRSDRPRLLYKIKYKSEYCQRISNICVVLSLACNFWNSSHVIQILASKLWLLSTAPLYVPHQLACQQHVSEIEKNRFFHMIGWTPVRSWQQTQHPNWRSSAIWRVGVAFVSQLAKLVKSWRAQGRNVALLVRVEKYDPSTHD